MTLPIVSAWLGCVRYFSRHKNVAEDEMGKFSAFLLLILSSRKQKINKQTCIGDTILDINKCYEKKVKHSKNLGSE